MRASTLVTGGSDGSVRVWSLETLSPIHRLAAHDNSVTSLQFNESRIISGGSDGRVKVWDLKSGALVRELSQPAEAVWRVVFEEEKAVVMASRNQRTVMEVWNFAPPEDELEGLVSGRSGSGTPLSMGGVDGAYDTASPSPDRSLLISVFHPPPQPAPPAPTILPIEAFPTLSRQQSQLHTAPQPHHPRPHYPISSTMRLLPDDGDVEMNGYGDVDMPDVSSPGVGGSGMSEAEVQQHNELTRHHSRQVPQPQLQQARPESRTSSSWLQLSGAREGAR